MVAVTVNTKTERSKMDWAGVDTGAKMLVGLRAEAADFAALAVAAGHKIARNTCRVPTSFDRFLSRLCM
jgi:poly(3-hydroxybutyrate) depolymerase